SPRNQRAGAPEKPGTTHPPKPAPRHHLENSSSSSIPAPAPLPNPDSQPREESRRRAPRENASNLHAISNSRPVSSDSNRAEFSSGTNAGTAPPGEAPPRRWGQVSAPTP